MAVAGARAGRLAVRMAHHDGTSLPGMLAERIDRSVVGGLAADLGRVVIVVGTNGKTTTSRLTARILESVDGAAPIANRSGANLRQGLASTLLAQAASNGHLRPAGRSAVFEVDELALERVIDDIPPTVLVILNLFRDQLDRFGEVELVVERWRSTLRRLPSSTIIVSCADDPRVDALAVASGHRLIRFGLMGDEPGQAPSNALVTKPGDAPEAALDPISCPVCRSALNTNWRSIGHLGDWACPLGHVRRSPPEIAVRAAPAAWPDPTVITIEGRFGRMTARIHLAGLAAAYDAGAAVAAAVALGIEPGTAIAALDGATPAFGRLEEAWIGRRRIVLALVKNPASMTESAEVAVAMAPDGLLLGLSDEPADGRDVSWIWDVDLRRLSAVPLIGLTGTRRDDMGLRLKYSDTPGSPRRAIVAQDGRPGTVLTAMLRAIPVDGTLVVLATYTSLLAIRSILEQHGAVPAAPR